MPRLSETQMKLTIDLEDFIQRVDCNMPTEQELTKGFQEIIDDGSIKTLDQKYRNIGMSFIKMNLCEER